MKTNSEKTLLKTQDAKGATNGDATVLQECVGSCIIVMWTLHK